MSHPIQHAPHLKTEPGTSARVQRADRGNMRHPVVLWAAVGAGFLGLAAYVWIAWIVSPYFRHSPVGPDPLPDNVHLMMRATEFIAFMVAGGLTLWIVVLPLMRQRKLSFDGMLLINFLLLWWTDPIDNYMNFSFMYNAHTVNMGSWAAFIPGWNSPNAENFPEPLLMMGGFYIAYWMLTTLLGCLMLRRMALRWPQLHLAWRLLGVFAAMALIDLVIENIFMRVGIAAYPAIPREWALFAGEVYQWPLYEAFIIGGVCVAFTCLRHFKDDKGQTFVERGIDQLRVSPGRKKAITFLAIAGFLQPFFLIAYYVPYNLFVVRADTAPPYPSYMRAGICGEGTRVACPSREWVPLPHRDGKLNVAPEDPRLPREVRDAQGITAGGVDPYAR